ncbi:MULTISPECIES: diguanylate cyclase [unclassified Oceanispirochaeta]|uniref:sensor domain-containing diguanylate cyclase n=1 Tax=unclassified Oceanispirochaeta TaxID=2635722 RepID=UPI000E09DB6A|nr:MULTISPECIES: diguanylate cyclase [unclassified Oceanispirochaeta]MBF9014458.1 diguanylate cyclase [Oceanispirochaeta sp. M2]NPD70714.1 diguanylate cyclase [Oceanispirochaeta sp. M1]RDG33998.1 diguanylate cyclase [Oceanispirochaeta sp. M1]
MNPEIQSTIDSRLQNGYLLTYKSLKDAQEEAENCLDDSEQALYFKGVINSRILLSLIALRKGETDLARERLTLIEEELNASSSVSEDSLMRMSQVRAAYFLDSAVYKDAFNSFVKCGNMAARLGNNLFQILSANGKGVIKLDQMEFKDAYDYFRVARSYVQGEELSLLNNVLALNIGCALNGLERYDEAFERLNDALEEAGKLGSPMIECSILDEISAMLIKQSRLEEAQNYLEKGLEKSSQHLFQEGHTQVVYHYATLLLKLGEYEKAEKLIEDLDENQVLDLDPIMYHQVAAEIFEQKGDFQKALHSSKEIQKINEKLRSTEVLHSVFKQEKRELQEQNHRLQLVSTIGQELVSTLDLGKILNLIYAQMNVLMPVDLLSISTVKGNEINVKFTLNKGERIEPFTLHKEDTDSIIAWCVRNKQEVFVRSINADASKYVRNLKPMKGNENNLLESVICIPLLHLGELEGVLTVEGKNPNSYNSQDLDNLRALASYVGIAIRNAMQTEQMTELNKLLKYQSSVDSLTGLVNRREFLRQSKNILRVCRRNNFPISLAMIDLDHFKIVNDSYGHHAGDEVLKAFGSLLDDYFKRPLDCVGRYGGEELIILSGNFPAAEAAARVELVREEFSTVEFKSGDNTFNVNFSCGIYGEIPTEDSSDHLNRITALADKYLYRAKEEGRNCSFLSDKKNKPAEKFIFSKSEH